MKKNLAVIEDRHPITVAIAHACKLGLVTSAEERKLVADMQETVTEATKKFVNFVNVESVRKALDITLGILSLPVAHSTGGKFEPNVWAQYVHERNLKKIVGEALALVRQIADTPFEAQFEKFTPEEGALRKHLIRYALARYEQRKTVWSGYEVFQSELQMRQFSEKRKQLVDWLTRDLLNCSGEHWFIGQIQKTGGSENTPGVHETINTLILRHCCGLSVEGKLEVKRVQFKRLRGAFEADKAAWIKKVRLKYDALFNQIPKELRYYLQHTGGDKWFSIYLSKGPPKVPKKWNDAQLPGITGIYAFEMFED